MISADGACDLPEDNNSRAGEDAYALSFDTRAPVAWR
jgi:hypothetical protein